MRPKGSAAELEARRIKALDLIRGGWKVVEVAQALGVAATTVSTWKNTPGGKRGLRAKPQHVPQCRLDGRQKRTLRAILLRGAKAAGFPTELWTTRRVAAVVQDRFGIHYHPDHLGRLLHDLGWSCQKPRRQAREQDPSAAEAWRKREWPRIKKGAKSPS